MGPAPPLTAITTAAEVNRPDGAEVHGEECLDQQEAQGRLAEEDSFTCKSRHARCDEKKPVCSNCKRLNLHCRASEFITPSAWCAAVDVPPRQRESNDRNDVRPTEPPTSTWDVFSSRAPDLSSEEVLQSTVPEPEFPSTQSPTLQPTPPPTTPITAETAYLLHVYQSGVATWMDLFDHACTYQRAVTRRVLVSELLLRYVCAFTAKHLSLLVSGEIWTPVATRYYGESLRMLIELLGSTAPQDDALTATMLLSSYEVIAAQGQEHRRHFFGAMTLIRSHGISARSLGLDKANFWIYVRHEIVVALVTESPLQMSPKEWNVSWRKDETEEDVLGNQLLWLLGRAIDLTYARNLSTGEPAATLSDRRELMRDVENWYEGLPDSFRGVEYGEVTQEGFMKLYFAVPATAAAMMWYHVMHILLYAEPHLQDPSQSSQVQHHATQIASIAISDIPDPVRVFSPQALFYAKHIRGLAKKSRIWALLDDVEIRLGFHTRSRVKKLQQLVEAMP